MQLWDGAKDPEKQKVGRLGQKERNYAAFPAATTPQKIMKIVVNVQGKSVEDKSLEITSPPNLVPAYNNSVTGTGDVLKSLRQGLNKQIKPGFSVQDTKIL